MWLRFRAKVFVITLQKNSNRIENKKVPKKSNDLAKSKYCGTGTYFKKYRWYRYGKSNSVQ